jgi:hypothetical protein
VGISIPTTSKNGIKEIYVSVQMTKSEKVMKIFDKTARERNLRKNNRKYSTNKVIIRSATHTSKVETKQSTMQNKNNWIVIYILFYLNVKINIARLLHIFQMFRWIFFFNI